MAIPAVTQECTPGYRHNSGKTMRLLPHREMRPDSHALHSNFMFPNKHVRSIDLLDGTPESPQEHCHNSRRKLMSLQECEIARCTPNQLEMKPDSPALAPEPCCFPHHTRHVA